MIQGSERNREGPYEREAHYGRKQTQTNVCISLTYYNVKETIGGNGEKLILIEKTSLPLSFNHLK